MDLSKRIIKRLWHKLLLVAERSPSLRNQRIKSLAFADEFFDDFGERGWGEFFAVRENQVKLTETLLALVSQVVQVEQSHDN